MSILIIIQRLHVYSIVYIHIYICIICWRKIGKNGDDACIGEASGASLRSVPPRVSNFFLSVSRSTTAANAKADLSRCAFIRVEEAMRNWPRPMKIGTIYVTHSSHSFSGSIRMKWTLTRGRDCDICQDVSSFDASHRSIFISPSESLSLSLSPSFVSASRPEEKVAEADSFRVEKRRLLVTSNDRLDPRIGEHVGV